MAPRGSIKLRHRTWLLQIRRTTPEGLVRWRSIRLGSLTELPTEAAARRAADRLLNRVSPRELHAGISMPWSDWCDRYIDTALAMHTKGTRDTQGSIIRAHLRPAFDCAVHQIDRAKVQEFVYSQSRAGVAPQTVAARFALLRRMLRLADREGLAATPPTAGNIDLPSGNTVHTTVRKKAFSLEECRKIMAEAPPRDAAAYACAFHIGLRGSEVMGLAWDLIDLRTGAIDVRQQALDGQLRPLKSKESYAVLKAPTALIERLKTYRETWVPNQEGFLFADEEGRPESSSELRSRLHLLLDRLGLTRRGLHGFRHACALAMADAGRNPEVIRRALRHSSLRITAIYLSAAPEDVAAAFESVSNSFTANQIPEARSQAAEA
jgi:integrase